MYKVILVDDEPASLNLMKKIIDIKCRILRLLPRRRAPLNVLKFESYIRGCFDYGYSHAESWRD